MIYETRFTIIRACKHGNFAFYRDDDPIGICLYYYGEWAEQEFDVISKLITPTSNCLDIGANIGTHTVWLSHKCSQGFTFSIEPQHYIHQILNTNIVLNDCLNVIPMKIGISNDYTEIGVDILAPTETTRKNYGEFKLKENADSPITVECKRLDDLNFMGKHIDFIKMDVEEHELSVLTSGKEFIARDKPSMYIEFNSVQGNDDLLHLLKEYGYNCYWHYYEKFNPNNHLNQSQNVWVDPGAIRTVDTISKFYEANLVAIHKTKDDKKLFTSPIEMGDNIVKLLLRNGLVTEKLTNK